MITREKMTENSKKFIELLQTCKRDGIRDLLDFLEAGTDFFTAPASSKYHNNIEGGLVDHCLQVYDHFSIKMISYDTERETRIICSLLHDLCKINTYKKGFKWVKNEETGYQWKKQVCWNIEDKLPLPHGTKSLYYIQQFIKLSEIEALIIAYHMGAPELPERYQFFNVCQKYPVVMLFHHADHQASLLSEKIYPLPYI